jgi:hypothetical protein
VFHVTKSGNESVTERRDAYDERIEGALEGVVSCELDELAESTEGDDLDEDLEDELEACSLEMLGI